MNVKPFRLSRRAVLRGAGGIAIALPWLEVMGSGRTSHAAPAPAKRFLTVYQPGGSVLDAWKPAAGATDFLASPSLTPLAQVRDHVLVIHGVDMKSAVGEQNQAGMVALLTGTQQGSQGLYAKGPSLDQVLATRLATEQQPLKSVEMAIRWGTGKARGVAHPIDILNYADSSAFEPIAPRIDPGLIWNELFGVRPVDPEAEWDRSILDAVVRRYATLSGRLGARDRARLEEHLTHIRELEQRIASVGAACSRPTLVDLPGYDPYAGLQSEDDITVTHPETDAAIPEVADLMTEMMVMALACELTSVGTLQFVDCEAKYSLPWLDLPNAHACYMNDCGYNAEACATICTDYAGRLARLIARMAEVDMGGHSLLDESVVFYGSHLQNVASHTKTDMPFVLAGGGGGLRTGRALSFDRASHNDLLSAMANLFGDPRTEFGDPTFATSPLAGLT
jgi:hypothetical protein